MLKTQSRDNKETVELWDSVLSCEDVILFNKDSLILHVDNLNMLKWFMAQQEHIKTMLGVQHSY